MNKGILLFFFFLLIASYNTNAQHTTLKLEPQNKTTARGSTLSEPVKVNLHKNTLSSWGLRIDGVDEPQQLQLRYKIKYDGKSWSALKTLQGDAHLMDTPHKWISGLQFFDIGEPHSHQSAQLQFILPGTTFAEAEFHLIHTPLTGRNTMKPRAESRAECEKPITINRSEWCDGSCPPDPTPQPTHQEFMIVHHSASSNTSDNWAAVVESFYVYHTEGNGWDDIGYNWLIDPNGAIYTGRGDELQGAHFCAQNSGTAGICMIGTYTDVRPTEVALQSLKELLGWKLNKEGLDPLATAYHSASDEVLPRITGHRIDCSTVCPGDVLFNILQSFPTEVKDYMENCGMKSENNIELTAQLTNGASVLLDWEVDSSVSGDWIIYRKAFDEAYEKIATIDGRNRRYIDRSVQYNYRYTYFVAAADMLKSNEDKVFVNISNVMEGITVYPIPTSGKLNINIANEERGAYDFKIVNMRGEEVSGNIYTDDYKKLSPFRSFTLDLSALQSGVYQLYIMKNEKIISRRIVVL